MVSRDVPGGQSDRPRPGRIHQVGVDLAAKQAWLTGVGTQRLGREIVAAGDHLEPARVLA